MGNINPSLYRLAQANDGSFHDITGGDTMIPCVQGSPNCVNGLVGLNAGFGYDLTTGLGSVDAYKLIAGWTTGTASSVKVVADPSITPYTGKHVRTNSKICLDLTFLSYDRVFYYRLIQVFHHVGYRL